MDDVHPGGLGGTYGGNPVACAAAIGAMATIRELDLNAAARRIGVVIGERLAKLAVASPSVGDVRGRGAMQAIEFVRPGTAEPDAEAARRVARDCYAQGVVVLTCGTFGNVVRLLPPLVIDDALLNQGLDVLEAAVETLVR
jgi:4-aminobutyrate aminotransferase/(S)-3-amino-2-methylpropionate transaminase